MPSLDAMLDRTRLLFGHRTAIVADDRRQSWTEHVDRVTRIAGALATLGINRGDKFAIIAKNSARQAELVHAAYWRGAVAVPINYRLAPPEIEFILEDAEASLVFVEQSSAGLAGNRNIIVFDGGADDVKDYEHLVAQADALPRAYCAPDDVAVLYYTGGTTGRSKGVPLTHRNVLSNGLQLVPVMAPRPDDIYLHLAPMFHSADLLGTPYTMVGAAHCYLGRFTGDDALTAVGRHGVTVSMMTPTMALAFLEARNRRAAPKHFRRLFYGSSPMAAERIQDLAAGFPGLGLQQGYGLTETSPILTTLNPDDHRAALEGINSAILRSVGRPLIGVDMRIDDGNGKALPNGEAGEIVVRGPNVFTAYHRRPEETRQAIHDGWFHTGDVGLLDRNGYLFLLDRKKDMIITGGENVYSVEVESVLAGHPAIREVAIVGVPDPHYGEALLAVVVHNPGASLSADAMLAFCRNKIGGYKIPRRIAVVEALPRSALGKVLKQELRKKFATTS